MLEKNGITNCDCQDNNHSDLNKIFEKIKILTDPSEKYNFENLTILDIINLLIMSENLFKNLFQYFSSYILNLRFNLNKKLINFEKNFRFFSFNSEINLLVYLASKTNYIYYFNPKLKEFFDFQTVFQLLDKTYFDNDTVMSEVKLNMISCFTKIRLMIDFSVCPIYTVKDIMNLNPLVRKMILTNIKEEKSINLEYIENKKFNFFDRILKIISNYLTVKKKSMNDYLILQELYLIYKIFSKYNLLTKDQITRLCSINDDVISNFSNERKYVVKSLNHNKNELINEILSILN